MKNRWGLEYLAHRVGSGGARVFPTRRLARQWAIRQPVGDWEIYRLWPSGLKQKLEVVGGYFDDWPSDEEDDD